MNVFIVSIPNEYERKKNIRIRNGLEEFFRLRSNLSNDNNFCLKARSENGFLEVWSKNGCENYIFWSEIRVRI